MCSSDLIPTIKSLSFSPLIVGIILGMLYANSLRNRLPETWVPGILFCSKQILRLGIILYGFKLTFQDVMAVGLPAILIDIIVVTVTICGGVLIGKWMKMEKEITLLTSVGSAICGAAAILGAESTIKSKPYQTAVAISTVVIFGTISMFLYPVLYRNGIVDLTPDQIEIVVHRQSVVHSAVEYQDCSVIAQLGVPDMKIPIQYALLYPERMPCPTKRLSLTDYSTLTFEKPDPETFTCLKTAIAAITAGGTAPCIVNGANEVAVAAFLAGKIGFLDIGALSQRAMESIEKTEITCYEDVIAADTKAREFVRSAISK